MKDFQDQNPKAFEKNQKRAVYIQLALFVIPMLVVAFIPLLMTLFPSFVVRMAGTSSITEVDAIVCNNGLKSYDKNPKVCDERGGVKETIRRYGCQDEKQILMVSEGHGDPVCFRHKRVGHLLGYRRSTEFGKKTTLP